MRHQRTYPGIPNSQQAVIDMLCTKHEKGSAAQSPTVHEICAFDLLSAAVPELDSELIPYLSTFILNGMVLMEGVSRYWADAHVWLLQSLVVRNPQSSRDAAIAFINKHFKSDLKGVSSTSRAANTIADGKRFAQNASFIREFCTLLEPRSASVVSDVVKTAASWAVHTTDPNIALQCLHIIDTPTSSPGTFESIEFVEIMLFDSIRSRDDEKLRLTVSILKNHRPSERAIKLALLMLLSGNIDHFGMALDVIENLMRTSSAQNSNKNNIANAYNNAWKSQISNPDSPYDEIAATVLSKGLLAERTLSRTLHLCESLAAATQPNDSLVLVVVICHAILACSAAKSSNGLVSPEIAKEFIRFANTVSTAAPFLPFFKKPTPPSMGPPKTASMASIPVTSRAGGSVNIKLYAERLRSLAAEFATSFGSSSFVRLPHCGRFLSFLFCRLLRFVQPSLKLATLYLFSHLLPHIFVHLTPVDVTEVAGIIIECTNDTDDTFVRGADVAMTLLVERAQTQSFNFLHPIIPRNFSVMSSATTNRGTFFGGSHSKDRDHAREDIMRAIWSHCAPDSRQANPNLERMISFGHTTSESSDMLETPTATSGSNSPPPGVTANEQQRQANRRSAVFKAIRGASPILQDVAGASAGKHHTEGSIAEGSAEGEDDEDDDSEASVAGQGSADGESDDEEFDV